MNKKQLMIELAMPVVFILAAIYIIVKAIPMKSEGVFPIMSASVLLLCAIYLLIEVLVKKEKIVKLEGVNLPMVGVTLLALVIYVVLLKKIGYIIDTFLLCVFIIRSLGYKKIGVIIMCSALAVAATFFIFKVLLSVPLPMVFLDF
ncbi:MAG: tripartite tricarboxylate transporter TctB family protein [Enterocloster sp.]